MCCVAKMMMRRRSRSFCCGRNAGVSANTLTELEVDGVFGTQSTMALQAMLGAEGYKPGPIDGRFGRRTKRAAQNMLKDKGYEFGPVDGWFGRRTIRAFQTWIHDLDVESARVLGPIDGYWGNRTTRALQMLLNTLRANAKEVAGGAIPTKEEPPVAEGKGTDAPAKPLVLMGQPAIDASAVKTRVPAPEAAGAA